MEDSVDIKPGGTLDSRQQEEDLSRRLIIAIAVCDHHDTTVTDSKGHKSWLPTQERGIQDQSPALYWLSLILRDTIAGYQLKKERYKINHLLLIGDLKIYGKNSTQIDSLHKQSQATQKT